MLGDGTIAGRLRRTTYARVLGLRDFRLLWIGQVVSNLGTYAYGVAVASALTGSLTGAALARTVAIVLAVQAGSAASVGLLVAGPIADRFSRRRVMIASDLLRAVAVASLLVGPASIVHLVVVAGVLGVAGALFEPSLAASLPGVVDERDLVTANAVVGGTFYAGVMVGPAIGALAIAFAGVDGAFVLNAASFVVSGALIARTSLSPRRRTEGRATPRVLARDLAEGVVHLRRSRLAVGIMAVMCLVVAVAGAQATIQVVFVREVLVPGVGESGARAAVLALLTTSWGAGMLIGCFATPPVIRFLPRERLIPLVVAIAGVCVLYGSQSTDVVGLAVLWAVAGAMCGITNISYESLLQERTLDAFRGRVISTIEAAQEGAYFVGVAAAAVLAAIPASRSLQWIGIAFTLTGVAATLVLRPAPSTETADPSDAPAQPEMPALPAFLPGMGSWPEWLSLDTPWAVRREHDVVTLEFRWPLVPSDWDRVLADLDGAVVDGVVALVLPVRLPRGSTLPHEHLEALWAAALERGVSVHRGDRHAPLPAA